MDMNDVIFSLGGIERITAPCDLNVSDEKLKFHLENNVIGNNIPTLEQVKSQIYIYKNIIKNPIFPIPFTVSMRQARLALLQNNLLDIVNTAINAGNEADKISWEYATEVNRSDALVQNLSAALGLSETDLDNLFILASSL